MSISGVSSSSLSWNTSTAVQGRIHGKGHHHKAPELSKDDLTQMEAQMKKDGKDTTNIDKMISNFDTLDTSKDGKISMSELKSAADSSGIKLPDGPPPGGPAGTGGAQQAWGPPSDFQMNQTDSDKDSDSSNSSSKSSTSASERFKSMLENLLSQFSQSNPTSSDTTASTAASVSISV